MVSKVVLHHFLDEALADRNILHTEKDIVPARHLCLHGKQLRTEYLLLCAVLSSLILRHSRIGSCILQLALIHITGCDQICALVVDDVRSG